MTERNTRWFTETIAPGLCQASALREIHYAGRTAYQDVEVLELGPFGRCLVLDGKTQSAEVDEFVYHEALVHPALITHPSPARVFIAGGGEGATLREVLAHDTVERAIMVDIDREVVDLCRQYLTSHHQGSFDDARAELVIRDAGAHLEQTDERFDVMVLDLPDPLEGGPAAFLYTRRFFELVKSRLAPDGLMVVQSGTSGPHNSHEILPAIHNTLETVFPIVAVHSVTVPSFGTQWGFTIGSLTHDPLALTPDDVDYRLAQRVTRRLRLYDGIAHRGITSLPRYLRDALDNEARVITEERPIYVI